MHANAHPHGDALRPGMVGLSTLDGNGCRNRIGGTSKCREDSVTLAADLLAVVLRERRTLQVPALFQHVSVTIAQLLQETRRALYVGEEQCDSPCWQIFPGMGWLGLAADGSLWLRWQQAQFASAFAEQFAELLRIVGAWPSSAPFPARDIEVQGSPDAISHVLLGPAAFQPGHAQQVIRGGLCCFFGHDSSET